MANAKFLFKTILIILLSILVFACKKKDANPEDPAIDQTNLVKIEINCSKPYKVMASGKVTYLNKTFEKESSQTLEFKTEDDDFMLMAQTLDGTKARFDCDVYFEGKLHSSVKNTNHSSYNALIVLRKTNQQSF